MDIKKIRTTREIVSTLFRDPEGESFELTDGQVGIFDCIWKRQNRRTRIICPTRYGKSRTVSMALVLRAATYPEKWAIIAPTARKAKIIMGYALEHALQNEYTRAKLELDADEDLDRLRRERSKNRLTFKMADGKGVGELFILSAEGHRVTGKGESLMGHGSPNVVLDESSLLDDVSYATVKRMLMDAKAGDSCLIEIGNPFYRNHFYRVGLDREYERIFIDYRQAIKEGRYTEKDIEEAQKEALFSILYECKFPDDDAADDEGWTALVPSTKLELAMREDSPDGFGVPKLGLDVAHGGNCWNVWVLRYQNVAYILRKDKNKNLMGLVGQTLQFMEEYDVLAPNVFIDATGVGAGVVDRLWEQKVSVTPFIAGGKASREDRFINRRAEASWRMMEWLNAGGILDKDEDWLEISDIKYRVQSDKKIQIMSKDAMAKRGIPSPDVSDALCLTFASQDVDRPTERLNLDMLEALEKRKAYTNIQSRVVAL